MFERYRGSTNNDNRIESRRFTACTTSPLATVSYDHRQDVIASQFSHKLFYVTKEISPSVDYDFSRLIDRPTVVA